MPTRYRAEVVGSFLRPPTLLQARVDRAAGKLKLEELRAAEDRAILSVFDGQKKAGMQLFTDGELRRGSWLTDMADAVEGSRTLFGTSNMLRRPLALTGEIRHGFFKTHENLCGNHP